MKRGENREITPGWVMTVLAVLLYVVVLAAVIGVVGRIVSHKKSSPEASVSAENSLTVEESGPDVSTDTAQSETSAPAQEEAGTTVPGTYRPVSGGVPVSNLAAEDDPYPALYVQMQEKSDDNTRKYIYLTFDDGPSDNTDKILEILDQYDVKAAFFVSGQYGTQEERGERYRKILEEGHTLGLHTYSHSYDKIYQSVDSFLADLNEINEEVYAATGYQANLIRFPGGSQNSHNKNICMRLAKEMTRRGYTYHDWAVSCGDAEGKELSPEQVMRETADECLKRTKSVVLFHDTPAQTSTVEALGGLIEELRGEGYEFRQLDGSIRPFQFQKVD